MNGVYEWNRMVENGSVRSDRGLIPDCDHFYYKSKINYYSIRKHVWQAVLAVLAKSLNGN